MPTYIDVHDLPGVKASDVVGAHEADVRVQDAYGVNYKHYWVDEEAGKVFCLVDAPDRATAGPGPSRGPRPRGPNALPGRTGRIATEPTSIGRQPPGRPPGGRSIPRS